MAELKLNITCTGSTNSANVSFLPKKYGKLGYLSLEGDDGTSAILTLINYFISNNYTYTDGCGNNIPYTAALALNGNFEPNAPGYDPTYSTPANLQDIIDKGGDLINHTYVHGGDSISRIENLTSLEDSLYRTNQYKFNGIAVPSADPGFATAGKSLGYGYVDSQNGTTFDGLPATHKLWPSALGTPPEFFCFVRDFSDNWQSTDEQNYFKGQIDLLFNGQRDFFIYGTHQTLTSQADFNGYLSVIDYLRSISNDRIAVASMREFVEYRQMRQCPMDVVKSGNNITVTINTDNLSDRVRWEDISLQVSGATVQSVSTDGFTSSSFNPTTGLVNGFKQTTNFSEIPVDPPVSILKSRFRYNIIGSVTPPDPDPETPSLTELENLLNSTFDHRTTARTARNSSNATATNGQEVNTLPDLGLQGSRSLTYTGVPLPNATRLKPKKYSHNNNPIDMILMENETGIQYGSTTQQGGRVGEAWQVIVHGSLFLYEAFKNSTFLRPYWAELSDTELRITNGNDNIIQSGIPVNTVSIHRFKFLDDGLNTNSGMVSTKYYQDGSLKNENIHSETFFRNQLAAGFGTDTNCALHGMLEEMEVYDRHLTDAEALEVTNKLKAYYGVGTEVQLPYAKNVGITRSGDTLSVNYTYYNPLGFPEDVSGRIIEWWSTPAGVQDGFIWHKNDNLSNVSISGMKFVAYTKPNDNTTYYRPILPGDDTTGLTLLNIRDARVNVRVRDTQGNIFWLPQAQYIGGLNN